MFRHQLITACQNSKHFCDQVKMLSRLFYFLSVIYSCRSEFDRGQGCAHAHAHKAEKLTADRIATNYQIFFLLFNVLFMFTPLSLIIDSLARSNTASLSLICSMNLVKDVLWTWK